MRQREKLEQMGKKILNISVTDILTSLPYLSSAVLSLDFCLDLTTASIGCDSAYIRFNPNYLFDVFRDSPTIVNRTYMHMLIHCLFRHLFSPRCFEHEELWDLASDIAAEHLLDGIDSPCIYKPLTDIREDIYSELEMEIGVFTAEKIYQRLLEADMEDYDLEKWRRTFKADDHSFWRRKKEEDNKNNDQQNREFPPIPLANVDMRLLKESEWDKISKRVQSEIDLLSGRASKESGNFSWLLSLSNDNYKDFRAYLKKFAVVREEIRIDPDTFDYGLYNYGMELYGNMPLIEENELAEVKKVSDLVIAIDTSASCKERLVKKFLEQSASILSSQESFFKKTNLYIIECDNFIQNETVITDLKSVSEYAKSFKAHGGYGTDFRPVFKRVDELIEKGTLKNLKGLMYFTDGFGDFPTRATSYETSFVFYKDAPFNEKDVPVWAIKLYF